MTVHRRLGRSGLTVSPIGLGTMTWGHAVDHHEATDHLRAFVDAGGTLVDTAHGYGGGEAETILGGLVGDVVPREDLVICTKAGITRARGERRRRRLPPRPDRRSSTPPWPAWAPTTSTSGSSTRGPTTSR